MDVRIEVVVVVVVVKVWSRSFLISIDCALEFAATGFQPESRALNKPSDTAGKSGDDQMPSTEECRCQGIGQLEMLPAVETQ